MWCGNITCSDHAMKSLKIAQPVLVKSLIDEFTFDEPNGACYQRHTFDVQGTQSLCGSSDKVPQECWYIAVFGKVVPS